MEIYQVQLSSTQPAGPGLRERLLPYISEQRRRKISRFVQAKDADRSLFSELLIRFIVMQKTNMHNSLITFETDAYGKPALAGCPDIHFNLSHSGDWVVCAWDPSSPVGIDIEAVRPIDFGLVNRFFSLQEVSQFSKVPEEDKKAYFYRLWTLKESFLKQIGTGLSVPLDSFAIRINRTDAELIHFDRQFTSDANYYFQTYEIGDREYYLSVCTRHKHDPYPIRTMTDLELSSLFLEML